MWSWLRGRRFTGYKFRRQHPLGIYYLDFFCEEAELNVELDGSQHGFPDQHKHDLEREKFLQSRGIKTLRFWNSHLRRNARKHPQVHDLQRVAVARASSIAGIYSTNQAAGEKEKRVNVRPHPNPLPRGEGFHIPRVFANRL